MDSQSPALNKHIGNQTERTVKEQKEIEDLIRDVFTQIQKKEDALPDEAKGNIIKARSTLKREGTIAFYEAFFNNFMLSESFDGEKTWVMFFLLYGLDLLSLDSRISDKIPDEKKNQIASYLGAFANSDGGFSGSGWLYSHLGTAYPLFLSIAILGTKEAYGLIDREKLRDWILSLRQPGVPGSYLIHENGEADLRAVYIAMVAGKLFNILTPEITEGVAEYIVQCQTYEGGLAPTIDCEAHAGYTYCGVAALSILGKIHVLDVPRLINWISNRQRDPEGGFNGRTNKIVDSCYSLWVGGVFSILNQELDYKVSNNGELLFDHLALQRYILLTCQGDKGGLKDKLTKKQDFYHSTYSLAGMSISQRKQGDNYANEFCFLENLTENQVKEIDSSLNIPKEAAQRCIHHFSSFPAL